MAEKKKTREQDLDAQWVDFVHGGTCCSHSDPMAKEKDVFCKEVLQEKADGNSGKDKTKG